MGKQGSSAARHGESRAGFPEYPMYQSDDQSASGYSHQNRLDPRNFPSNHGRQREHIIRTQYEPSASQPASDFYHDDQHLESGFEGGGYHDPVFDDRSTTPSPDPGLEGRRHYSGPESTAHRQQTQPHLANSVGSHHHDDSHRVPVMSQSELQRADSVKTSTSRHGNVMVETMSAPHPCCPNTKGVCCLMILLNLSLILVSLGFVIVLQLFRPAFVWYIGVILLVAGFAALLFCLVYCSWVCGGSRRFRSSNGQLYWTHHWRRQWGPSHPDSSVSAHPHKQHS